MYLLGSYLSSGMFALGVLVLIVTLMRRWRRYYRKTKHRARVPLRQREPSRAQPLLDAPPEVTRWQVEMHELTRELKAEIDSKLTALQVVINLAREERERLTATIARAKSAGREVPNRVDQAHGSLGTRRERARPSDIYRLADQGCRASTIADELGAAVGEVELLLSIRGD